MDAALQASRSEVERQFGQCLLRLQAYELSMKAILSASNIEVRKGSERPKVCNPNVNDKSLGTVKNLLLDSFLTTAENPRSTDMSDDVPEGVSIRIRTQVGYPAEKLDEIKRDLTYFVTLRNELVHHFLEKHNPGTLEGCRSALEALQNISLLIDRHSTDIRAWAGDVEEIHRRAAESLSSDAIRDFFVKSIIF